MGDTKNDTTNQEEQGQDGINDPLTRLDVDAPQTDWKIEGDPEEEEPG